LNTKYSASRQLSDIFGDNSYDKDSRGSVIDRDLPKVNDFTPRKQINKDKMKVQLIYDSQTKYKGL
jgi:hypothetical protein